jgi:uncharacterized DUF497 family protein
VEFDWDDGNMDKSLYAHGIQDEEIELAFSDPFKKPGDRRTVGSEERKTILARAVGSGRYLKIVYTERVLAGRTVVRPISARQITARERARYSR